MLGGKFSKQLTTSKRKWLTELRESDASVGGWNADATQSDRPMGDLAEVFNLRKMRPGELETRAGFKQWHFDERTTTIEGSRHTFRKRPLAKCEYRLNDIFVDVTLYTESGSLFALILQPGLSGETAIDETDPRFTGTFGATPATNSIFICNCGESPVASCYQYQTFLVVTVVADDLAAVTSSAGAGVYGLLPTDTTLVAWQAPIPIGKTVCPTPSAYTFSPTITGKLLVRVPTGHTESGNLGPGVDNGHMITDYQKDPTTGEFVITALDIKAPYFLAETQLTSPHLPRWKYNTKDPVSGDMGLADHLKSRGWLYRFVFKRKFNDPRGNEIIVTSSPSADMYVEDRSYIPPFDGVIANGVLTFPLGIIQDTVNQPPRIVTGATRPFTFTGGTAWPTGADWVNLSKKFLDAQGGKQIEDPNDLLYFVATALGDAGQHNDSAALYRTVTSGLGIGDPPYELAASSFLISGAPNAIFKWSDFAGISADTYAIDVYRTAYCYPDPKESDLKGTGYGPYVYGYAGTIDRDGTFIDSIQDVALLMEETPDQFEGYLEGQFAGEVIRPYQGHLVLGNTRSKYWLKTPTATIQSFAYSLGAAVVSYSVNDLIMGAPDGLPVHQWYYAYQDTNKRLSDAVRIDGAQIFPDSTGKPDLGVAFLFPRGYSVLIDSAVLIHSIWIYATHGADAVGNGTSTVTFSSGAFDGTFVGKSIAINGTVYTINVVNSTTSLMLNGVVPSGTGLNYFVIDGGARHYYKESVTPVADGVYISKSFVAPGLGELTPALNADGTLALRDVVQSTDPGAIIWSKPDHLFLWPTENFLNVHDQDPVRALDEVIGPLYVFSDRGVKMTREQGTEPFAYLEPVHTSLTGVGCISRYACVKANNVVFFLSSQGLMYVEGSGVVSFPANIQTEIRKRLTEKIPGKASLSGVRNLVSMSFLTNRNELWITFPSTIELGGVYATRTFVLKIYDKGATSSMHAAWSQPTVFAYEFEIANLWDKTIHENSFDVSSPNPTGLVIHLPHSDGSMFSAFEVPESLQRDGTTYPARLIVQDVDREEFAWPGQWAFQYQHAMGSPSTSKQISTVRIEAEVNSRMFLVTGMLRTDGLFDRDRGTINTGSAIREMQQLADGEHTQYAWPVSGSLVETSGCPPAVRLTGRPTALGDNHFKIEAFDLYFGYLHQHKGD